jgi:hypothetical protein
MNGNNKPASILDAKEVNRAIRLTFSYTNNEIKLISKQIIKKVLPPSFSIDDSKDYSGFWYQVTDDAQRILYLQVIHDPVRVYAEIFSNNPEDESISRKKIENIQGTFTILLPEIPDASKMAIFASPFDPELINEPAKEIFQLSLRNIFGKNNSED